MRRGTNTSYRRLKDKFCVEFKAGRRLNFAEYDDDCDDDLFITCLYNPVSCHFYVSVEVPEMKSNKTFQTFTLLCLHGHSSYLHSVGSYCKALPAIKLCNKPLLT